MSRLLSIFFKIGPIPVLQQVVALEDNESEVAFYRGRETELFWYQIDRKLNLILKTKC